MDKRIIDKKGRKKKQEKAGRGWDEKEGGESGEKLKNELDEE